MFGYSIQTFGQRTTCVIGCLVNIGVTFRPQTLALHVLGMHTVVKKTEPLYLIFPFLLFISFILFFNFWSKSVHDEPSFVQFCASFDDLVA